MAVFATTLGALNCRQAARACAAGVVLLAMPLRGQGTPRGWALAVEPSAGGKGGVVTAVLQEQPDSASVLPDVPATLVIRCVGRTLDAYLTTRDQLTSDFAGVVRARVQFDGGRTKESPWEASRDGTGAFIPAPDLRDIIQRGVLRATTIRISVPTQRRGHAVYRFAGGGFATALVALRDACVSDRGGALALP